MFQLMPLPLTVSCFSKIQIGFAFLVPAHLGGPGERAVKRVCVCHLYVPSSDVMESIVTGTLYMICDNSIYLIIYKYTE